MNVKENNINDIFKDIFKNSFKQTYKKSECITRNNIIKYILLMKLNILFIITLM